MLRRQRHRARGIAATALLAGVLACGLAAQAQTNVYRWVDSDGKVHFTDVPPPPNAKDVSQKRLGGGDVGSPQAPYATQQAAKRNPVTLYSSTKCGDPCEQGRALLAKRGIPYTERQADMDPAYGEKVKELTGKLQVPVLVVGEKPVPGFADESWHSALDAAGYAKTAIPGQVALPQRAPEAAQPPSPSTERAPPAPPATR